MRGSSGERSSSTNGHLAVEVRFLADSAEMINALMMMKTTAQWVLDKNKIKVLIMSERSRPDYRCLTGPREAGEYRLCR